MEDTKQVTEVVEVPTIQKSIEQYKAQHDALQQQIAALDQNYTQQRDNAVAALHQLAGAIAALDLLIPKDGAEAPKG